MLLYTIPILLEKLLAMLTIFVIKGLDKHNN